MKILKCVAPAILLVAVFAGTGFAQGAPAPVPGAPAAYDPGYPATYPISPDGQPAAGAVCGDDQAYGSSCQSCCETACGGCGGSCLPGWCHPGHPWTLPQPHFLDCHGIQMGGWVQGGYHSGDTGLFNDRPDAFNIHQTWLYLQREADGSRGLDWGFRTDLLYGIDGADTQAFGNPPGTWDYLNGWDHGAYGWALPQFYGELAEGDLSVIFGHFYTVMGYEVVQAPDNFFYSRALTMFNSEPLTHTGVLATYSVSDNLEVYAGWTLGWDTGFKRLGNGNSWLGGFGYSLADNLKLTYVSTAGDLGWRGEGYSHSVVLDWQATGRLNYVIQSDLVSTNGVLLGDEVTFLPGVWNDQFGINQYLLYRINDCLAAGLRAEWWHTDGISVNEVTYGLNIRPIPNLVIRPEVRHQWIPSASADFRDQNIFGIDAYVTF